MNFQFIAHLYIYLLVVSIFGIGTTQLYGSILCANTFNMSSLEESDPTSIFLTYLGNILDSDAVSVHDLRRLQISLRNNTIENPIEYSTAATNPILQLSWEFFEELIREKTLNSERILLWVSETLDEMEAATHYTKQQVGLTKNKLITPMEFHPIKISDNHYIEVMNIPVTQYLWTSIMGKNPSKFSTGYDAVVHRINNQKILIKPNHPVEQITLFSALEFSNVLSRQRGLDPYYDFSNTTWEENTSAADGTLQIIKILGKFNPSGFGYRLPRNEEQSFYTGTAKNAFNSCLKLDLLSRGWFLENSNGQTQEVGTLNPIYFQDKPFFDLLGNVMEWQTHSKNHPFNSYGFNYFYGGSFLHSTNNLEEDIFLQTYKRDSTIGFRLVRTITKEEYMERAR